MVETNSGKTVAGVGAGAKSAVSALLSLERAQKLDLLKHLITNLRQSLVVCGPEGIGKTTLLDNLVASKPDSWDVYAIKSAAQLSFEQAQADLLQYLQQSDHAFVGQNLEQILNAAEKNNQKIVFLIDDAGLLVPGLITAICQFASAYPALRMVFALTADELHVKNSSDKAVDDCHFIDIPTLSEQQCGDFLKNLSSKPGAIISAENLNSAMIGMVYRESHGIPGKIVNIQKGQIKVSPLNNWQWIAAAAAILIAVAVSFFLWDDDADKPETQQQQTEENLAKQQAEVIQEKAVPYPPIIEDIETKLPFSPDVVSVEIESLVEGATSESGSADLKIEETIAVDENKVFGAPALEIKPDKESPKAIKATQIETTKKTLTIDSKTHGNVVPTASKILGANKEIKNSPIAATDKKTVINAADEGTKLVKENQKPLAKQVQIETTEKKPIELVKQKTEPLAKQEFSKPTANKEPAESSDLQGISWVLDQKASYYSLQLMAISKQRKAAMLKTINKHSQLQDKLHYFEIVKKGEKKYILLYGSFSTLAEAKQAIKKLPKEFAKPWLRRFKVLHKQINATRR